ncbi:hypothetical protein EDC96DRAFT_562204 [Choanephora cucurbitarum]|nr:hypothetical protein EDC96DRAFT_562204 [Choanephora cucurbitarum]
MTANNMTTSSDEDLTARLKEYEKRENALKEKLKEEHTQLVNYQKKLAQAGTHLKTLAQENTTLKKSLSDRESEQQAISSRIQALEADLTETKKDHQKKAQKLVELIKHSDGSSLPDISDDASFEAYVQSVQKRLEKEPTEDQAHQHEIDILNTRIQELQTFDSTAAIEESLSNIIQDPENGTINSSAPPSLLLLLEQLRTTLIQQQDKIKAAESHLKDTTLDLKRQVTQLQATINQLTEEKEEEAQKALEQLAKAEKERDASQEREKQLSQEHKSLLGKLSHIKENLAPRLEQDKQLRQRVAELTKDLEETVRELEQCRSNMVMREEEHSLQLEHKEKTVAQLSSRLETVQQEREEYEQMAMQLDAQCSQLQRELDVKVTEMEQWKAQMDTDRALFESERSSLSNLQTVLEEFQANCGLAKDAEMQAAVEHIERQLDVAKKSWAEYEERAHVAEVISKLDLAELERLQRDIQKTQQYEKEVKEKNLLIGKLRHEAIILNEHLVEAMRKLKEETSESNVDRQLITNLFIGFLMAPRGDRKRYDILTIISNVLQLSEEQKEQIGLLRPKHGTMQPGSPTIEQPQKESFTDAWISFLLKESSPLRRNRSSGSLPINSPDSQLEL